MNLHMCAKFGANRPSRLVAFPEFVLRLVRLFAAVRADFDFLDSQQQASGICFTHGRPPSDRGRCHVDLMEGVEKILTDHPCELILIAPKWPNQSWYARLLELLVDFPLVLPLRKDLLTQPHNHLRHQSLQAVRLHAWRLSSDPSKRKDFLKQLPSRYLEGDASLHELSTTASGESSLVGVVTNRLIHSKSLFRS